MRAAHVRSRANFRTPARMSGLFVTCRHCGHERAVNMDEWPDDATVSPPTRCSACGKLGATAAPNWIGRADRLPGGARR
jgi:hypothetical protein